MTTHFSEIMTHDNKKTMPRTGKIYEKETQNTKKRECAKVDLKNNKRQRLIKMKKRGGGNKANSSKLVEKLPVDLVVTN